MKNLDDIAAYYSAIVESSDDVIISKNLDGTITSWNKSAERIFGYTAEEAIGKHISLIIPPELMSEEAEIISKLKQGIRIDHYETVRQTKTGDRVNLSITVSPIRNAKGEIVGASKIARDISERIRTEKELIELSRRKDEFLANISHELRTPLNAVVGIASILGSTKPLTDQQKKFIDTLNLSANNLLALINDLLDFSKLEEDSVEFETIEFDLSEIVASVAPVMEIRAREKDLRFSANLSPDLNETYIGDPLRLQQIMTNLVSNAIKFTDKGLVTLDLDKTASPDDSDSIILQISVRDTGIGIPHDKMDIIFEKFSQADPSITRRFGGTGLGLSITRTLVERLGGAIVVESEPGRGSIFRVDLPLNRARNATREKESETEIPAEADRKNILLVEDYEPNILVTGTLLMEFGYNHDVARNGVEALARFEQARYDAILMDIQMCEMDGIEATRRIRQLECERQLSPTPIIAMTAHVTERDKDKFLSHGMDDFLPKPFNPAELAAKLNRQIKSAAMPESVKSKARN